MYHPTTRVLTVLELLQAYGRLSGKALASRLEVDTRTVRRYIVMLQDMGVPIESERGRDGHYSLAKGFKLPPMMFTTDEALALALGLQVIRHIGMSHTPVAIEGTWAKLSRVLPRDIGAQLDALMQSLIIELGMTDTPSMDEGLLATLSIAIQQQVQVNLQYEAFSGELTQRAFNPYRVVYRGARWYVVGYCHLRQDVRVFRLDRIRKAHIMDVSFPPPPSDFDAMAHVEAGLARTPGIYRIQIEFFAPIDEMMRHIPKVLGELIPTSTGTMLTCFVQQLGWFAGYIAGLGIPFRIHEPQELIHQMEKLLEQIKLALEHP